MGLFYALKSFTASMINQRFLLLEMTQKDFQARYLGSYLGIIWAFVQPVVNIIVLWFVFEVGFRSAPVQDFPFILWLVCGMVPWFFISDCILNATPAIIDNCYLVKKVVFRVSLLPIIKILSALFIHLFFILLMSVFFALYGYMPNLYNLQIFYYVLATAVLVTGISFITSSVTVFVRDFKEIIAMIVQITFWFTPIFWSLQIIPEQYRDIIALNPVYYLIEGYRETFIYSKWFWEDFDSMVYFWLVALIILFIGILLYRKMRPHFADVL